MSFDPQVQALIDQGAITREQALAAKAAAPAPGTLTGVARCMNQQCEQFGEPRPIKLRRETREIRAEDLPVIISSTSYLIAEDDSQLQCPECKMPCALQEHEPPRYASMSAFGA